MEYRITPQFHYYSVLIPVLEIAWSQVVLEIIAVPKYPAASMFRPDALCGCY